VTRLRSPAFCMKSQLKTASLAIIGLAGIALGLFAAFGQVPLRQGLSVTVARIGSTASGPFATFTLTNREQRTIQLDPYCTVYWKNELGSATSCFVLHGLGNYCLTRGASRNVTVSAPDHSQIWWSSFTYTIVPGFSQRVCRFLKSRFGGLSDDNAFVGTISPNITNGLPRGYQSIDR